MVKTDAPGDNANGNAGVASVTLEEETVRGYGRVDSAESLDRAREVSNELARLHRILPMLTNSELSAYSTKSLPIGTFLNSKGHVFSVLTEDMLAEQFKQELERRKGGTRAEQWIKNITNIPVVTVVVVLGVFIVGAVPVAEGVGKLWAIIHRVPVPAPNSGPGQPTAPGTDFEVALARDMTIGVDLCVFDRDKEQVFECVAHGACRGPGALGLGFPIDKTSVESAIYSCKQSCISEARRLHERCNTPPPF